MESYFLGSWTLSPGVWEGACLKDAVFEKTQVARV